MSARASTAVGGDSTYRAAVEAARFLVELGVEPTSAMKQAASDVGIAYGDEMAKFVAWARKCL